MKEKMEQSYLIPGFLLGIVRCTDHKHLGKLQSIRNQIYEKDQELLSYLSGDKLYLLFTGRKEEQKTAEFLREVGPVQGFFQVERVFSRDDLFLHDGRK